MSDSERMISMAEVRKHNTRQSCWVVLRGKVYDLTSFLSDHPAGAGVILAQAGKDGTAAFDPFHPSDIISRLGLEDKLCLGRVDPSTITDADTASITASVTASSSSDPSSADWEKPPLSHMLNMFDFEAVASRVMHAQGWDYYSSGADDEITLRENRSAFHRIYIKPRVLIDVSHVDTRTSALSAAFAFPLYITATALGKLAHPDGELALLRAAAKKGIPYMLPTLASCTLDEMLDAKTPTQDTFFQLYVNSDKDVTRKLIRRAEEGGCKALCVTVDAPCLGRREKDLRHKFTFKEAAVQEGEGRGGGGSGSGGGSGGDGGVDRSQGTARAISSFIDPSLNWKDLAWIRASTSMPLVLKGIQCGEDAVLAAAHGVDGIIVSNHGGRQLDTCRSGVEVLAEVMAALRSVGADKSMVVLMDGGVRRGSDILKAVALGAQAVGIGRPTLYALASYGQPGVERALDLLKTELEMTMRLTGVTTVDAISEYHIIADDVKRHLSAPAIDSLAVSTYIPLRSNL